MLEIGNRLCGFSRRDAGRYGEDLALSYLTNLGLTLIAKNWYSGHCELDMVMEDDCFIRFIEVRTLVYPNTVEPFETINIKKQRNVMNAARNFIGLYKIKKEVVFDVVSIVFNGENFKIEYIKNAFTPLW